MSAPRFTYVAGKGGVGKTTVAAAYATFRAAENPRKTVLLISTDPAHSLGDIFQTELGDDIHRLRANGRLFARQIDPDREVANFLKDHAEGLVQVIESGTFFTRSEIEPLLNASFPGMAELAALLALDHLHTASEYDEVVVDTAPIGHTLRMFEVPQHLERVLGFLEAAGSRDQAIAEQFAHRQLKEHPTVAKWRKMVERVRGAMTGPVSQVFIVTTPEELALQETWRVLEQLRGIGIAPSTAVVNRAVLRETRCWRCASRARQTRRGLRETKQRFQKVLIGADAGGPVLGAEALQAFGRHVFEETPLRLKLEPPKVNSEITLTPEAWPRLEVPLTLVLGKGGVGKTTVSAGLVSHERRSERRSRVTVCSIDPAPSLDDVFKADIDDTPRSVLGDEGLRAVEFDAVAAFRKWAEGLKYRIERALQGESGGFHIDLSFDRRTISALLDVTPPGIDEVFAVFRMRELTETGERVVIDMAPTGHALEVLRTPARLLGWCRLLLKSLAAHRTLTLAQDAAVEIAGVAQEVRAFSSSLTDPAHTRAWPVMLAEPLPDKETGRLLAALKGAKVERSGLLINRVLFEQDVVGCARCQRERQWQSATLYKLQEEMGSDLEAYCIREFGGEVSGKSGLQRLTKQIWRIG